MVGSRESLFHLHITKRSLNEVTAKAAQQSFCSEQDGEQDNQLLHLAYCSIWPISEKKRLFHAMKFETQGHAAEIRLRGSAGPVADRQ